MSDSVLCTRLGASALCVLPHWELYELDAVVIPISQMRKQALSGYGNGRLSCKGGAQTVGQEPGWSQPCAVRVPLHPTPPPPSQVPKMEAE